MIDRIEMRGRHDIDVVVNDHVTIELIRGVDGLESLELWGIRIDGVKYRIKGGQLPPGPLRDEVKTRLHITEEIR